MRFWPGLLDWCIWRLMYAAGAFAARMGRPVAFAPVFDLRTRGRRGHDMFLVDSMAGEGGRLPGQSSDGRQSDQTWADPARQAVQQDLAALPLLGEQYPELIDSGDEPLRSLVEFDFVVSPGLSMRGRNALGRWTEYERSALEFTRELHGDEQRRVQVAEAIGVSLERLTPRRPQRSALLIRWGGFPDFGAVEILETGSLDWPPGSRSS